MRPVQTRKQHTYMCIIYARTYVRAHAQANKLVCEELAWGLREKKTKNVQLCKLWTKQDY